MTGRPQTIAALGATIAALTAASGEAGAMSPSAECRPARLADRVSGMPEPWQRALDELIAATAREGQPWSCPDARVSLRLVSDGAELEVRNPDGRVVERHVETPEDLRAVGQALLARAGFTSAPGPGEEGASGARDRAAAGAGQPHLFLDALVGPRFTGPRQVIWTGFGARATIPLGAWGAALWMRVDAPVAELEPHISMDSVSVGFGATRRFTGQRFAFELSIDPSLTVIAQEKHGHDTGPHEEGARTALRIGAAARGFVRLSEIFRGTAALDGELSPQDFDDSRRIGPELPPLPAYGAGLSVGVEAVIP